MAYDPESEDQPKSRFEELKCYVRDDRRANSDWYQECDLDFGFYAGGDQQWKKSDVDALEKEQKPWTTFNFIQPSVSAVNGMEVSNRQQVKFLPRTTQTGQQPAGNGMGGGALGAQAPAGVGPSQAMVGQQVPGADDQGPADTVSAANYYL